MGTREPYVNRFEGARIYARSLAVTAVFRRSAFDPDRPPVGTKPHPWLKGVYVYPTHEDHLIWRVSAGRWAIATKSHDMRPVAPVIDLGFELGVGNVLEDVVVLPTVARLPLRTENRVVADRPIRARKLFPTHHTEMAATLIPTELRISGSTGRDGSVKLWAEAIIGREHVRRDGTPRALVQLAFTRCCPVRYERRERLRSLAGALHDLIRFADRDGVEFDRAQRSGLDIGTVGVDLLEDDVVFDIELPTPNGRERFILSETALARGT
ncbi:MAG: hypothetical protein HYV09_29230 [Deltaproteobacteria bacterium]|nr:hypothetical protein [Deltaproteobacteria bacterium]